MNKNIKSVLFLFVFAVSGSLIAGESPVKPAIEMNVTTGSVSTESDVNKSKVEEKINKDIEKVASEGTKQSFLEGAKAKLDAACTEFKTNKNYQWAACVVVVVAVAVAAVKIYNAMNKKEEVRKPYLRK